MKYLFSIAIIFNLCTGIYAQDIQDKNRSMDLLVNYGNMTALDTKNAGCCNTLYIVIPEEHQNYFYVRLFDPDCGGKNDSSNGLWETNTQFIFLGGEGCMQMAIRKDQLRDAQVQQGTLLQKELYADEPRIDNSWVSFGPFSAQQGAKLEEYKGRFFKLVVEGKTGNDGNKFAVAISASDQENTELKGAALYMDEIAFVADLEEGKYNYSLIAEPIDE